MNSKNNESKSKLNEENAKVLDFACFTWQFYVYILWDVEAKSTVKTSQAIISLISIKYISNIFGFKILDMIFHVCFESTYRSKFWYFKAMHIYNLDRIKTRVKHTCIYWTYFYNNV